MGYYFLYVKYSLNDILLFWTSDVKQNQPPRAARGRVGGWKTDDIASKNFRKRRGERVERAPGYSTYQAVPGYLTG